MLKKIVVWLMSMVMFCTVFAGIPVFSQTHRSAYLYTSKNCSMPQAGTAKTVFFLVEFPDKPNKNPAITANAVFQKYYNSKDKNSLSGFYAASSIGNLNIKGKVYGWYTTKHNRSYYSGSGGNEKLYQEVISYYDRKGVDFRNYDGDGDGIVDCVYMLFAGGDTGYGTDWWSYSGYLQDSSFKADGRKFGSYVKLAANDVQTAIHETGHTLGLWDYYQIDPKGTPSYGIGGYDIMDDNLGDHNALSKMMLGWITPKVVFSKDLTTPVTVSLRNQSKGDCVVFFPGNKIDFGSDYYVIEYLTKTGYYAGNKNLSDGAFRILHVQGTDNMGRLKVSLVEADENNRLSGLQKWRKSDLFSSGMVYSQTENHVLFLKDAEDVQSGLVYFFPDEEKIAGNADKISCSTKSLLLKRNTAYSPVVTNQNGISVNQQLDWVSVKSQIANVNQNGKITALSAGNTVVVGTRTRKDGSVDAIVIYVYVVPKLSDVSFQPKTTILTPGTSTQMIIKANGIDLTKTLKSRWSTSNPRISVSQSGKITAKKVGVTTVKVTLQGGIRLTYQFTVDFKPLKASVRETSSGNAQVVWNQISGASGYKIYRYNYKTKENPVVIATISKNNIVSYTDKKVKQGIGYAYQVFAFDATQSDVIYSKGSGWKNIKIK